MLDQSYPIAYSSERSSLFIFRSKEFTGAPEVKVVGQVEILLVLLLYLDHVQRVSELFLDPAISNPKWEIGKFLLKKKLGLRGLLEVIPLDATLVKGSHGRDLVEDGEKPLIFLS